MNVSDLGIGIIGCGNIVKECHLPAYKKAGFRVVGLADIDNSALNLVSKKYRIKKAYNDYRKLLDLKEVKIVDIAIPDKGRVEIVKEAAKRGKHILIQKPFAHRLKDAEKMVMSAHNHKVKLAVNQNGRWAPIYRKTKEIIKSGRLGKIYLLTLQTRTPGAVHLSPSSWFAQMKRFMFLDFGIHRLDIIRWWFDQMPRYVFAVIIKKPNIRIRGETTGIATLDFGPNLKASITIDTGSSMPKEELRSFRIDGTTAVLRGTHTFKEGGSLELMNADSSLRKETIRPEGSWFLDGFIGTMKELMESIIQNREPEHSGEDNLKTLKMVFAVYRSVTEKRAIKL